MIQLNQGNHMHSRMRQRKTNPLELTKAEMNDALNDAFGDNKEKEDEAKEAENADQSAATE